MPSLSSSSNYSENDTPVSESDSTSKLIDTKKTVNPYISIVQVMYIIINYYVRFLAIFNIQYDV